LDDKYTVLKYGREQEAENSFFFRLKKIKIGFFLGVPTSNISSASHQNRHLFHPH
jgi:hypothetical protein